MQKELEELQPQLVETAKENTKMMKVCTILVTELQTSMTEAWQYSRNLNCFLTGN